MSENRHSGGVVLATPFRLFFLLAGVTAALWLPLWLVVLFYGKQLASNLGGVGWHAHEMVFGYTGAVLAGFLLTAARAWTGRATLAGVPLLLLVLLWVAGRAVALRSADLSPMLPVWIDGGFWLAVAAATAWPIAAARSMRNAAFPVLLVVIGAADVIVHLHVTGAVSPLWSARALHVALDAIALVIFVFGGRIVPMFTANALGATARRKGWLDWTGLTLATAVLAADAAGATGDAAHGLAIAAGLANAARLWGWNGLRTLRAPILWVLHIGWLALAASFVTRGLAGLFPTSVAPAAATHMLTIGGIGVTTMGMMARVSLGHTGRPLVAPRTAAIAFGLLVVAVVVRVGAAFGSAALYMEGVRASGMLWAAAFALFTARYAPILLSPRADGKPG